VLDDSSALVIQKGDQINLVGVMCPSPIVQVRLLCLSNETSHKPSRVQIGLCGLDNLKMQIKLAVHLHYGTLADLFASAFFTLCPPTLHCMQYCRTASTTLLGTTLTGRPGATFGLGMS